MNKLLLTFLALLLCSGVFAQSDKEKSKPQNEPVISFQKTEHDFGDVVQGSIIEHDFIFENRGIKPIFISDIITTCGCIDVEWIDKPVTKGKTAILKVKFDTSGKSGYQNKLITIVSNAVNEEERIVMKGNVLPDKSRTK